MASIIQGECKILRSIKWYNSLNFSKGRRTEGFYKVEGYRAVKQIFDKTQDLIDSIIVIEGLEFADINSGNIYNVPENVFNKISTDKSSQGIIAIIKIPETYRSENFPNEFEQKVLILEDIQDPGNVGALIRSAAAFGYSGAILTSGCADPFSPKASHASMGALVSMWIKRIDSIETIITKLNKVGFQIIATDLSGDTNMKFHTIKKIALILGNEGNGISEIVREKSDILFKIPINSDAVESLNVAAAGAIAMFVIK